MQSENIGGEGIQDVDVLECLFIGINESYSDVFDDKVCIIYELEYELELNCNSYNYWGRDDDTKEDKTSPPIEHTFRGRVVVSIKRSIQRREIELNHNYLVEDKDYVVGVYASHRKRMDEK